MTCSGTSGLTDVGRLMGRSFHGNPGSGSHSAGDLGVAYDAPLVVEGEWQRHETGLAETETHVRAVIRGHAEKEESSASRTPDLAAIGAPVPRNLIPAVALRRAHALRQTALELPAFVQQCSELRQITGHERSRHGGGQLFDAMQTARDLAIGARSGTLRPQQVGRVAGPARRNQE